MPVVPSGLVTGALANAVVIRRPASRVRRCGGMKSSSTKMSLCRGSAPIAGRSRSIVPSLSVSTPFVSHSSGSASPSVSPPSTFRL